MTPHRSRLILAALLIGIGLTHAPADARADTGETAPPPRTALPTDWAWEPTPSGWALPFSYLGWGESVSFRSDEPVAVVDLPHSRTHALHRFEFTLEIPEAAGAVTLRVSLDDDLVYQERHAPGTIRDVVLDLSGSGDQIKIETFRDATNSCALLDRPHHARLVDPVLFYRADPTATDDLDFAPPDVVTSATFLVEPSRSHFADGAVLDATTNLARAFAGTQRFAVASTVEPPDQADIGPFGLIVAISERGEAGVRETGTATVGVVGRAETLITQSRGLDRAIDALGASDSLVVQRAPTPAGDVASGPRPVSDLPGSRLLEAGGRQLEVIVPLSQPTFGQPVARYDVRLGGVLSPAEPADLGGSQLTLWLGDDLLEIIEVTPQGRFDTETTVSAEDIGRASALRLRFDAADDSCGRTDLYHLQLDPASWVLASPGQTLAPGLERFPQVAGAGLRVLPGRDQDQLSLTAEMVGLLQESMPAALTIDVVDRAASLQGTGPLLVVDPDVELQEALGAPTNPRLGRLDTGDVQIVSEDSLDFAIALQGFVASSGADVIMVEGSAHAGSGGLPDVLVDRGIGLLTGSTLIVGTDGEVVNVAGIQQSREAPELLASTAVEPETGSARSSFTTGLFLAGIGGAVVVASKPLRRRARP